MSTQRNRLRDLESRLERIKAALQFEFGINLDDPVDDLIADECPSIVRTCSMPYRLRRLVAALCRN